MFFSSELQTRKRENYPKSSVSKNLVPYQQSQGVVMPTMMRDRFELLSAYLDGEVTATEGQQVEDWLASDPEARNLYHRLLNVRSAFQSMPVPTPQKSAQQLANAVFQSIDAEKQRQRRWAWQGGAIAALFLATLSGVMVNRQTTTQVAETPAPLKASDDVMIALNEPVVEILNPNTAILSVNQPVVEIPKVSNTPKQQ